MGLQDLLVAASIPVLKLLLVTALGSFLATDRANILGEDARKHLNNVIFFVFSPALVASSLATTITYETMIMLWFMPFNILITFIIGSLLGWLIIQFTTPPQHLRALIVGCCSSGNHGYMLLIIIPAVCKEKGSPFGDPDLCHAYGIAYASLSMIGAIYLWSYVYNIMRVSSSRNDAAFKTRNTSMSISSSEHKKPLLNDNPVLEEHVDAPFLPCTIESKVTTSNAKKKYLSMLFGKINLKALFAPSTTAALVGFIVALVPQIQSSIIGSDAPLRVILDSASLLGGGAIPAVTLIMGANLLNGIRVPGVAKSLVIGIIIARYIALPLFGILTVKAAVRFGLVQASPLYQFVLLLQFTVPPAMNMGTITQLFGAGQSECSVVLLWTYSLASISITLWSTFFMWLVSS